jgi:hypothetical protein
MMSFSTSWRPFAISASVVGLSLFAGGCINANRQATASHAAIVGKPQSKPSPATAPATAWQQEQRELEAQNVRLLGKIRRLQNELDQQISARLAEMERDFGGLSVDIHSEDITTRSLLEKMRLKRVESSQDLSVVKSRLKAMDQTLKDGKPWPQANREAIADPRVVGLRQRLDALDIDIAVAGKEATPDQAAIAKLKRQREAVQQKYDLVLNELTESRTEALRRELEERALILDQQVYALGESVAQTEKELGKINELRSEYEVLKSKERRYRERIAALELEREDVLDKLEMMRSTRTTTMLTPKP